MKAIYHIVIPCKAEESDAIKRVLDEKYRKTIKNICFSDKVYYFCIVKPFFECTTWKTKKFCG